MSPHPPVPVFQPYLGEEVKKAAVDALDDGWLGMGPLTAQFEQEIGAYLGAGDRPVVVTNSGTAALHCATALAGAGPGDEVICPSFQYAAGHQAISATGADVVFCDIEERTYGADPESVRALISPRTKAIMVVHYAGIICDLDAIYDVAHEHGVRVIEDAAHAFGSRHRGRPIGSFGDLTCFSFGPVKVITSLEGGAVVGHSPDDTQPLHELRFIGIDSDTRTRYERGRNWEYDVVRQGFRYHLSSIPAAIGLSQLAMVDGFISSRQRSCRLYSELLADVREVTVPETDWADVSPFIFFIRVPSDRRADLVAHLKAQGISSGVHWVGAHQLTYYKGCRRSELPVTERVASEVLTLPLHSHMADGLVERVAGAVSGFFAG